MQKSAVESKLQKVFYLMVNLGFLLWLFFFANSVEWVGVIIFSPVLFLLLALFIDSPKKTYLWFEKYKINKVGTLLLLFTLSVYVIALLNGLTDMSEVDILFPAPLEEDYGIGIKMLFFIFFFLSTLTIYIQAVSTIFNIAMIFGLQNKEPNLLRSLAFVDAIIILMLVIPLVSSGGDDFWQILKPLGVLSIFLVWIPLLFSFSYKRDYVEPSMPVLTRKGIFKSVLLIGLGVVSLMSFIVVSEEGWMVTWIVL